MQQDYFTSIPVSHTHRYWMYPLVTITVLALGAFWYYERTHIPTVATLPPPVAPQESSLTELQAAALGTDIPIVSDDF